MLLSSFPKSELDPLLPVHIPLLSLFYIPPSGWDFNVHLIMAHGGIMSQKSETEKEEVSSLGLNFQRTSNVWEYPVSTDSKPNNKVKIAAKCYRNVQNCSNKV